MREFNAHAAKLMAADPRLSIGIARAKAIEALHGTCVRYWDARAQLSRMGVVPVLFDEV